MNTTASWYENLVKPSFAPPSYVFGIAWSIIYPLIFLSFGYITYLVFKKKAPKAAIAPLIINLIANFSFSYIQFVLQNNLLAAIDILVVLITIIWLMIVIKKSSRLAMLMQIPYLMWVSFATILQFSITLLNL